MLHGIVIRLATLAITAALVSSCAFGDNEDIIALNGADSSSYTLYVAGRYLDTACVWIVSGAAKYRMVLPRPGGSFFSSANAVAFHDGKVYVSGDYDSGGWRYPCLWVNGVFTALPGIGAAGIFNGTGVALSGDNVYVSGYHNTVAGHACLWINGVLVMLPENGGTQSRANSVRITEQGILVSGMVNVGSQSVCYWLNGILVVLDAGAGAPEGFDAVYSPAGVITAGLALGNTVHVWFNTIGNRLQLGTNSSIRSVEMLDSLFVAAGSDFNGSMRQACHWLGPAGSRIMLPVANPGVLSEAWRLHHYTPSNGIPMIITAGNHGGETIPCIWVNGIRTDLDNVGATSSAFDVAIGPPLAEGIH